MTDKKQRSIRRETFEQMLTLLTASFGLVAALAWNQFAQDFIRIYVKPVVGENTGLWVTLGYAVIITVFAALITLLATRFMEKDS